MHIETASKIIYHECLEIKNNRDQNTNYVELVNTYCIHIINCPFLSHKMNNYNKPIKD